MPLQRFLIAPYSSGFDEEVESWLLPQEAFTELINGFIYRGVLQNRQGMSQFAIGGQGSTKQCQSRMIDASTAIVGAPITTDGTGAASFTLSDIPIRENDVIITIGAETIIDDGLGILTGDVAATGIVNYVTGAITITGAAVATGVTITYNYYPGDSITGMKEYNTSSNVNNPLIVFDENRANKYNVSTNRFDLISGGTFTGGATDFVSSDNFMSLTYSLAATTSIATINPGANETPGASQTNPCIIATSTAHGLKTNDEVKIASVGGMTELNTNVAYEVRVQDASGERNGNTDGVGDITFQTNNPPRRNDITIDVGSGAETITDNGAGILTGSVAATGTIDYDTGSIVITGSIASSPVTSTYNTKTFELIDVDARRFSTYTSGGTVARITGNIADQRLLIFTNNVDPVQVYNGSSISLYSAEDGYREPSAARGGALTTALHVLYFNGRLLFLRPTQSGTTYPQRVLYTGTGPNRNDFTSSDAGFIDAPTGGWIQSFAIYKGELIIFFDEATFMLKSTGVGTVPFRFVQLDESRSIKAPFGAISYLNKTIAIGPLGILGTDGYRIARIDNKIPNFTTNEIIQDRFNQVYAGRWDFNRQHIFLYPDANNNDNDGDSNYSTAALAANYEENTFSRYLFRMTVLGRYKEKFGQRWSDLNEVWESYSNKWSQFSDEEDAFFMAAGDDRGFIYRFSDSDYDDANFRITGITTANPGVISTTSNTLMNGDVVKINSVMGMTEINDAHYTVASRTETSIQLEDANGILLDTSGFTPYTSGGIIQKSISFSASTKLLNPFIEQERKARLAYIDIYMSTRGPDVVSISEEGTGQFNNGSEVTFTTDNIPLSPNSISVTDGTETFADNGDGTLTGSAGGTGTVDYNDGTISIIFAASSNDAVLVDYGYTFPSVFVEFFVDDTRNSYKRVSVYPNTSTGLRKKFVRVAVNQTANFHRIRISQNVADKKLEIHGMVLAMEPAGPLARTA